MRLLQKLQRWLLRPALGNHPHALQLEAISKLLDDHLDIAALAQNDLVPGKNADRGRKGMNGDQVVRVLLLKQIHDCSYRKLEFHLQDSLAFRGFARAPTHKPWKWTTLQMNIKRLKPSTLESINRILVRLAREAGIETGNKIRTDCTAVESNIHAPTDSSLLSDGVRVLARLLHRVREKVPRANIVFSDHSRRARRREQAITFPAKGKKRQQHLRENYLVLLKVTRKTCGYARAAIEQLKPEHFTASDIMEQLLAESLSRQLSGFLNTIEQVIDQTSRRVLRGESVPADEKIFSIFETHTDVIVKGGREVVFGHKVLLTSGSSSLILDCSVQDGNPADATLVRTTLERQIEIYGKAPRQVSFDGGFASKENLRIAKEDLKIRDVAFHKKCGLEIKDMTSSPWVYRQLKHFRSGIEGIISTLKGRGMERCKWRSQGVLNSFRSYVWGCVLAFNVLVIARHLAPAT